MLPTSLQRLAGIESQDGEYRFSDLVNDDLATQQDEATDVPAAHVLPMSGADARKRKKREQRKAHKAAQAQPHVQWGSVAVFSFSHVVGGSAVPSKGIYPISLGAEVEELRVSMPLDEHVSQTQADLLHRAQALGLQIPLVPSAAAPAASVPIPIPRSGKSGKSSTGGAATPPAIISKSSSSSGGSSSSSNSSSSSSSSLTPPPPGHAYAALETRQFDYRRGQHNQLFSPLTEEERRLVLVDMESWGSGTSLLSAHHTPPPRAAGSLEKRGDAALLGEGDSRTPPRASAGGGGADSRKQRSNSATSVTSVTDTGSPGLPGSAHATAHTANTHHVAEHHKEIRAIQKSRSEHLGCSCKAIKVDKLSVVKMKETYAQVCGSLGGFEAVSTMAAQAEMAAVARQQGAEQGGGQTSEASGASRADKGLDSPPRAAPLSKAQLDALSKADLAATLRDVLRFCSLCTRDCECLQLGIGCSGETCGCLRREGQRGSISASISSLDADPAALAGASLLPNQACGNPFGRQLFDQEAVNAYRKRVLASLHNGVISWAAFEAY